MDMRVIITTIKNVLGGKDVNVVPSLYGCKLNEERKNKNNYGNYKIPKWGKDVSDLTIEDCLSIIGVSWSNWRETKKRSSKSPTKKTSSK